MIRTYIAFLLSLVILTPSAVTFAQTTTASPDAPKAILTPGAGVPTGMPTGLSSCFDHYRFGSVPAVINTSLSNGYQSGTMGFTGTLTNENAYPILDATVWVKIFHKRSVGKDVDGPDVVDVFPAVEHVTLKAKEVVPLAFSWKVPADIEPGEYQAATFVTSSDRFELLGLSFTDDVIGNKADFKIGGEKTGAIRFAKDSVSVGDQKFSFAAFPPVVPVGAKNIPVSAKIVNTTPTPLETKVVWSLYYWDSLQKEHLLDTKTEVITVSASSTLAVTYTVTDTAHTVYFLKGVVTSKHGTSSIVGIRFVRSDVNEPRLNFVAIDGNTAVACIHSTGHSSAEDSNVSLTVTNNVWYTPILRFIHLGTLASASYAGAIPGDIYALTAKVPGGVANYSVHAVLSQKGSVIDSVTLDYSCTDLGTTCPSMISKILQIVIPLVVLLVIGGGVLYLLRKRREKKAEASLAWNNPSQQ